MSNNVQEHVTRREFLNILNEAVLLFQETCAYYQSSEEGRLLYLSVKKLLNHCNCISVILDGTCFEAIENSDQIDHSSAKILLRSVIEIYTTLTSLFWFEGKEDLSEKEFKFLVYKYSGLKSRQKLNHDGIVSSLREKASNESNEVENLKKMIKFKGGELGKNESHIRKLTEKGWQAKSIQSRLQETTLPQFIKMQYSYLCGYSHSGFDSYMQLAQDESSNIRKTTNKEMLYFTTSFLLAKLNQASLFNLADNIEVKIKLYETYKLLNKHDINHSD
ncbi:DUF5677 domain-containing protein [Pseudoalteromonas agarivorans]|uniref:DUF5677 domain-containing protein n=1 Tax=Pseudoalteromonas agarivorans TaxID=176102 RepID=UPI00311E721D